MIPIHLKIKGLYSYRELVEIDFEKLTENHLFGIFGAVGSGKSAILEAITFALYGKTERLNSSGDNRGYNMMNLQSHELLIEFEFKSATSGQEERYQFRVKQTRNSKNFTDVRSATRNAFLWKQGEWQPLESADATQVLKLSYDNFIKTIIIPQGKFQDFLHMGATDRTRMLRELFGLDRFELDRGTKRLLEENQLELVRLEEQLKPLAEASPAEIALKETESKELETKLQQLKGEAELLQVAVQKFQQLQALSLKIADAKQQLEALASKRAAMEARAQNLAQYRKVRERFSDSLSQMERLERSWKQAEDAFTQAQTQLQTLEAQRETAQQAAAQAKAEWEQRGQIEAQIRDCGHWVAIRQADAELAKLEDRLKNGQAYLSKGEADIQANLAAIATAEANLATEKATLPDLAMLGEVQMWFQQHSQITRQISQIDGQIGDAQRQADRLQADMAAILSGLDTEESPAAEALPALQNALNATKTRLAATRDQRDHLTRQGGLAAYAVDLKPGEPCPLCGADHHPAPYDSGHSAQQLAAFATQLSELEQQQTAQEKALQAAQAISVRLEENGKQQQQLAQQRSVTQSQAEAHSLAFKWPQYSIDAPQQVDADRRAALETQARIAQAEQALEALRKQGSELDKNQKKYEAALTQLREDRNRFVGQVEAHRQQLTVLLDPTHEAMAEPALTALSQALQSRLAALQAALDATQKAEKALDIQVAETRQKRASAEADRLRLGQELQVARQDLDAKLAASEMADLDAIRGILAQQLDTEREQAAIEQFRNSLLALETTLKTLEAQALDQHYDAAAHATAEGALATARARIEEVQEALSLLRDAITRMQEALLRRKDLEIKQDTLKKRHENLRILEGMFKASGFVKYVSTIYLEDLVRRADARFSKLTRNALSLELGLENEFLVRDMLNGGQTRSVKTLSGGQTFQASLCLALALADIVQQSSGSSHNFFFLDEGFGTLDKDSLNAVFDALKQLRQENRIVGVISHVDDMQQEIEVYLRVWQTEERGSLARGSWEI